MPDNTTELLTEQSTVAEKQLSYYNFSGVKRKETIDDRKKYVTISIRMNVSPFIPYSSVPNKRIATAI